MALGLLRGAFSVKRSPLHDIQLASSDFAQRVTAPVHGLLTWIDSAPLGACHSAPTRFRHSLTRRALKSKFPILSRLYPQVKASSKNAGTWLYRPIRRARLFQKQRAEQRITSFGALRAQPLGPSAARRLLPP